MGALRFTPRLRDRAPLEIHDSRETWGIEDMVTAESGSSSSQPTSELLLCLLNYFEYLLPFHFIRRLPTMNRSKKRAQSGVEPGVPDLIKTRLPRDSHGPFL